MKAPISAVSKLDVTGARRFTPTWVLELRIRADRKIRLDLVNRTPDTVVVMVDEARFVGPAGEESGVFASARFDEAPPRGCAKGGRERSGWRLSSG